MALYIASVIIIILLVFILSELIKVQRSFAGSISAATELLAEMRGVNKNIYGYTKKINDILAAKVSPETDTHLREIISKLDAGLRELGEAPPWEIATVLKTQEKLLREIRDHLALIEINTDKRMRLEDDPF